MNCIRTSKLNSNKRNSTVISINRQLTQETNIQQEVICTIKVVTNVFKIGPDVEPVDQLGHWITSSTN